MFDFLFGKKTKSNVQVLNAQDFAAKLKERKGVLIDVRSPQEFKAGHIKKAINIDFRSPSFTSGFTKYKKDQPIFLYCRSGMRSMLGARKLSQMGFTEIYDLKGGYLKWH